MPRTVPPVVHERRMRELAQPTLSVPPSLDLRHWDPADAAALVAAFADPDIQHWHMRRLDTEEEARAWISG